MESFVFEVNAAIVNAVLNKRNTWLAKTNRSGSYKVVVDRAHSARLDRPYFNLVRTMLGGNLKDRILSIEGISRVEVGKVSDGVEVVPLFQV